jgi:NADPH2:quinone reductase
VSKRYLAVVADELGPPENYRLESLERAALRDTEVRIAIVSVAVSYVDSLIASGGYQLRPATPYIPGSEACGRVIEIGREVSKFAVGDTVVVTNHGGLFSQEVTVESGQVRILPAGYSAAEGAALSTSYATAWHALFDRAAVQPGEYVLILGAGGALGLAAIQVARLLGARVIACASSLEKRAAALAQGACATISSDPENWRDRLLDVLSGNLVDVVFDPVGGPLTERAFRSISWRGRHLIIGFPGGIVSIKTNLPLLKGASLIGIDVRQFAEREPELASANLDRIFDLASKGAFRPKVGPTYQLEDFKAAMLHASDGSTIGRVMLDVNPRLA